MDQPTLLAVPNVSEGRSRAVIEQIGQAFAQNRTRLLDVHSDADHHRSVFTLAGRSGELAEALLSGARVAVKRIDIVSRAAGDTSASEAGQHPHVGALDVAPIVYLDERARGAACAEALLLADGIGEQLGVPVFLYGELTAEPPALGRTRAQLRRGGVLALAERMAPSADRQSTDLPSASVAAAGTHPLTPDFGPARLHPSAGATLVAARPPLVAFNLQLASPATLRQAREIAALIREGGEQGLPGLRAIGVQLAGGVAQVSMNVEQPFQTPLASVVEAVACHAELASAELVGLAPAAALVGFPEGLPMSGFDPARHVIENALGC